MDEDIVFHPERRRGLLVQSGAAMVLVAVGVGGLVQAFRAQIGPEFVLYLLFSLLALGLVPLLIYRAYALRRAYYAMERDGIRLHWGLRAEVIPMDEVNWVRPAGQSGFSLPLPWLRWPGAVLGVRRLPNGGQVEFLASSSDRLILIATPQRIFAVSPVNPGDFLRAFQRFNELGSLTPLLARSIYPSFLLARVWATKPARYLLISGLVLSLILLMWVSLAIPTRPAVVMGPGGLRGEPVASRGLLVLPLLNAFFFLADLALGLFFFRREEVPEANAGKTLAYTLWSSAVISTLAFMVAVYFVLQAG